MKEQNGEKERAREKGGRVRDSAWLGKGYNFSPILQFGDTPYCVKEIKAISFNSAEAVFLAMCDPSISEL